VPFLFAMSWSTLAIALMVRQEVPSWPLTLATGLATGLAIATRTGGVITHAYLVGGMSLCALEALLRHGRAGHAQLRQLALHTLLIILIAWLTAIALWPWLQIGNPLVQFLEAYRHFGTLDTSFEFQNWGRPTFTDNVPAWYIPGQLLARLPEGFLALLLLGMVDPRHPRRPAPVRHRGTATSRGRARGIARGDGRQCGGVRAYRGAHPAGLDAL
jgi:hypothetical protein